MLRVQIRVRILSGNSTNSLRLKRATQRQGKTPHDIQSTEIPSPRTTQVVCLKRFKWRRRESNACPVECNQHALQDVRSTTEALSGNCQEFLCARCHQLAVGDTPLGVLLGAYDQDRLNIGEIAWQLAKQCRSIVQACLREEEWQDADREFYNVIRQGISMCTEYSTVAPTR